MTESHFCSGKETESKSIDAKNCSQQSISETLSTVIRKYPNRIALSNENANWTYSQLDNAVTVAASKLIEEGISSGDNVALLMPRSEKLILSLLAVLKIGAAYVPIDPNSPNKRIDFILNDTNAKAIILDDSLSHNFQNLEVLVLTNNMFQFETTDSLNTETKHPNVPEGIGGQNLAYIIYTSGSTGTPKGVQVTHANLQNYSYWARTEYEMDEHDIADFSTSLAFDASVGSTIVPLLTGARIHICSEATKALPHKYLKHLVRYKITLIKPTPTYFSQLVGLIENPIPLSLRAIIIGGEALITSDLKDWLDFFPKHLIINEYGPTEATVGTLSYKILYGDPCLNTNSLPIGKPAYNTKLYILDSDYHPCPIGETGELFISGNSVSAGYLNRPELNQEQFLSDLQGVPDKVYKTGDLARMAPDGNIEYLGRLDRQIKIRGFRIEPGEIEHLLLQHESIESVSIQPFTKEGETKLISYLTYSSVEPPSVFELRHYLKKHFPEYMVPSYFIPLDKMPLTVNGKLDKDALPLPNDDLNNSEIVLPENETEKSILDIWVSVLNRSFGVTDDFFILGGESINAAQIIYQVEKKLSVQLSLYEFYKYSNVRDLSKAVQNKTSEIIKNNESLSAILAEIETMTESEIKQQLDS